MKNQNYDKLEAALVKQAARRSKKTKPVMKVSGASVKQLQKLIKGKAK